MKRKGPVFRIKDIDEREYQLEGKGKGIGDGISWFWIGDFRCRSYCYLMIKALTLRIKEKKD